MADDEQFSLCWNNFNTNLSAGFHESLCRGDLVDVSLAAEGQIVKAHRLVLSVCSPFFRKMFTQMPSNTHAIVFLNNVSHSALKDLIQFMYCGEVNVKQDALPAFISTAESLQIKGLTDNDPAPQPPQEPTPPPAAPHVQQQQQQIPAQRVQRQQPRASARYKIETVDDVLGDDKATTQIVIQTTAAPQATIVQQPQQQQQQHIQTQQLQTGTTTTATLVSTNKRSAAQRGSLIGTGAVKRSKTTTTSSTTTANVIDPLESTTDTSANAATSTQQLGTQQITVQTTVVAGDTKVHQVRQQQQQQQQQQAAAQEEAEYIDLPMELPTKSEPDYSEEHAEVAGDGDTAYVEDDTYGDMRYDDSYFTENEDAGNQTGGNTSTSIAATTSKAVVKQQSQSYSDSSFVDTGADQGNTEAQVDVKVELSSEASATPTRVPETDGCLAAFAAAYLSDDDTMAIRKPYTLPKILDETTKSKRRKQALLFDGIATFKVIGHNSPRFHCFKDRIRVRLQDRSRKRKHRDYDGTAVFVATARNHPKLIIGQNQFISHRGVGKIGTWRCSKHSKGCKARVFTFAMGTEIKYRFSCASHIHRSVNTKSTYFKKKLAKKFVNQE
ncbi:modifier of mdg4-like isoform X2 [Drosophila hydei]|uniref:Modifier of mdg4-like isoform X2 n=1 Tax=Drosophila hydei TaxID=7224 RepID=A0A6J1MF25_DROHY|nr:modifier of mdg4-like isoform X2 [Drosophila hydei]